MGYFIPHIKNKKADLGFKVLKKWTSTTEKIKKMPKNIQIWACLGVFK